MTVLCSIIGCGRPHLAKGWCAMHYQRWQRHGDPVKTSRAPDGEPMRWIEAHVGYRGEGCLIWPYSKSRTGYGAVNGERAHRLMCGLAHGEPPSALHEAAHSCGNGHGSCIHPQHLRWATPKENAADRKAHGTHQTEQFRVKLTPDDVIAIREWDAPDTEAAIAFGVSQRTIGKVRRRESWRHVA